MAVRVLEGLVMRAERSQGVKPMEELGELITRDRLKIEIHGVS